MTIAEEASRPAAGLEVAQRWLPALLLLFVGSGCAALIYEVVWFQLLQLSIGSSAVSLGVLLGIFMGGMCLGSLVTPRFLDKSRHPLRVYAMLELGIGICGLLVMWLVPVLGNAYTAWSGTSGPVSLVLRAGVAGICLIPPTLLMGATLPAIARWVETTPRGVAWLGYFYGGNLAGAVVGSMLAGYYLLRVYDMPTATYVAVAINVVVAVLALLIAQWTPHRVSDVQSDTAPALAVNSESRLVYVAIALSGLTALGAEVVWTRLLSLLFGATAYTFSMILAVFLVGLGIGSTLGSALSRGSSNPRAALGWCQVGLCAALAWAAYSTGSSLPFWPINPSISTSLSYTFQLDLMRAIWVMLPGAILWGASFPLALAAVATKGQDPARLVGGVYAANTVGAIFGALLTALVMVGTVGSQITQQALIGIAALSGLLMLGGTSSTEKSSIPALVRVVAIAAVAGLLARVVPPLPGILVAYGRYAATWVGQNEIVYVGEGVTASVAVSRTPSGALNYHNAGKVQASSEPQDMRLQRMLGHITTLVPKNPNKVLVIGCGAGVTAGAVSIDPMVKDQTIAEIEPLVPQVVSTHFAEHNFDVVRNPKVKVHLDDARHYLLTTNEKFDAITSDPLDPWVKGAATLYTREFFNEVKSHLNPGGVVTLFVQLYESTEEAAKSEVATFLEAFPNGAVFANTINGQGYDLVLFGQKEGGTIDVDAVQARLADPANAAVAQSLREIGINSAVELFGTYAGQSADMAGWLKDGIINTDRNLKLQYLAGQGLNLYRSDPIYKAMIRDSKYPGDKLFTGSKETLDALSARVNAALGGAPN